MNTQIPAPIVCGMCGAFAGFTFGNCQLYPIWLGAAIGGSVGCLMCTIMCLFEPVPVALPVALPVPPPTIVNHIHIYELAGTGAPKVTGTNTESDVPSK